MTEKQDTFPRDAMYRRFCLYGFLKNLRLFDPFLVLFFREAGLSFLQIGLLYSIRDLSTTILEIPAGVYADGFGRRRSMVMSFIAYIISFILFFAWPGFAPYAGAMLLFALGDALRTGTHKALILEHLKLNDLSQFKVAYYGRTRGSSQFGSAINSLLAAALVFYTGSYRFIFLASTLPYVLDLINLATYPAALDGELIRLRRGAIMQQIRDTVSAFWQMLHNEGMLRAILNSSSFDAYFKSTKDYLQPILQSFALALPILLTLEDTKRASVVIGLVYFVLYLLTSTASRSSARFGRRFTGLGSAINSSYGLGALLLIVAGLAAWRQYAAVSIIVLIFFYALYNLRRPINVAYVSDQIDSGLMASGLSVESQLNTLLMVIIAPILGALADAWGVGAALAVLGGLMFLTGRQVSVKD